MASRPDQIMAEDLQVFITEGTIPPKAHAKMARNHAAAFPKVGPTNLVHMGSAICALLKLPSAEEQLAKVYRANYANVFRSVFEGLSVGYSGYQSLGWLAMVKCSWLSPTLREDAREQLRWDLTIQSLCSTIHGRVVISCGRVYATPPDKGVVVPATDYRVRAVRGISNDGWWPPPGVGPRFWTNSDSVSARPWKKDPDLPELLFSVAERAALQAWCVKREVSQVLRDLIFPIRVAQVLTIAHTVTGHLAWMLDLRSYAEGKNCAQPLVWALGDNLHRAVVQDPPTGANLTLSGFVVNGKPVEGFPVPGLPQIRFSGSVPPEVRALA